MKLFQESELKNDKISAKKDERIYFCPYCKALCLYDENEKSPRHFHFNNATKKYRCLNCDEGFKNPFDHSTYAETKTLYRHVPFHLNGLSSDDIVNPFIANAISSLRDEDFSNRSIQKITHFPRALIGKIVLKQWNEPNGGIPIEEFFEEYLKLSAELCSKLKERKPLDDDLKKEFVKQALLYGCSYDVIRQLLPIRRMKITQIAQQTCSNPEVRNEIAISKANRKIEIISDELVRRVKVTTLEKK